MEYNLYEIKKIIGIAHYELKTFFNVDYCYNELEFMQKENETEEIYYDRLKSELIKLLKVLKENYNDRNIKVCWTDEILKKLKSEVNFMKMTINDLKNLIEEAHEELYDTFEEDVEFNPKKYEQEQNETNEEYYQRLKSNLRLLLEEVNNSYKEYGLESKWANYILSKLD